MAIRRTTVTVTGAAGGAGIATANAASPIISGIIRAVHLAYTDSPPAGTTDVTIVEQHNSPAMTVLSITNAATDGWFYPQTAAQTTAGAAITDSYAPIVVNDNLLVTIAQANNGDGVVATIVWEE